MPDEDVGVAMTTRRMVFLLSLVVVLVSVSPIGQTQTFDVLIRDGQIFDGSGNPWFSGDIGIKGDRIAAVGRLPGATATRVIDATGLAVAPGFIDMHAHSDTAVLSNGLAESKVRQGVTLEVLGEGTSVAPRDGLTDEPEPGVRRTVDHVHRLFPAAHETGRVGERGLLRVGGSGAASGAGIYRARSNARGARKDETTRCPVDEGRRRRPRCTI